MTEPRLFLIGDVVGFSPQIGRLVSMMNYARWTILRDVEGLSVAQLDHLFDSKSNSIGALLLHIAAVETAFQVATFENRELDSTERTQWDAALELGERARLEIQGNDLNYYVSLLGTVREKTFSGFLEREDAWLYEESPFWKDRPANNYFKWFHVFEDEINHRGQIRWLRKRIVERV
jgi:uncharacterized damage-inducible protein DinB